MYKLFSLLGFLIFLSCSQDCSDCENKLNECLKSTPIPVDLPTGVPDQAADSHTTITVNVTENNEYKIADKTYPFDELTQVIRDHLIQTSSKSIKIAGDKMAHYEKIFRLISFSKTEGISPILVYSNE